MSIFLAKKNNAKSTLSQALSQSATIMNVVDSSKFPSSSPFLLTIWNKTNYPDPADDVTMEIVKVTGINGGTFTIERGQEDTIAKAHKKAQAIEMLITAGMVNEAQGFNFLTLTTPTPDGETNDTTVVVSGKTMRNSGTGDAKPSMTIKENIVPSNDITIDGSNPLMYDFSYELALDEGENEIEIICDNGTLTRRTFNYTRASQPVVGDMIVIYPTAQTSVKAGESVTVEIICSGFDTIEYTSSYFDIPNPTTYEPQKEITYNGSGDEQIGVVTLTINAQNSANGT
ncbi:unnamed protein product, partial [marine sediment metagenome]